MAKDRRILIKRCCAGIKMRVDWRPDADNSNSPPVGREIHRVQFGVA